MTDQLILNFPIVKNYLKEDFYVSSSNKDAYDYIQILRDEQKASRI